jgi:hypothetical protein
MGGVGVGGLALNVPAAPPAANSGPGQFQWTKGQFIAQDAAANGLKNIATQAYAREVFKMDLGLRDKKAIEQSPTAAVLVSFQVMQNNNEIRVLDQDGSVYSGFVQATGADLSGQENKVGGNEQRQATAKRAAPATPQERADAPAQMSGNNLNYSFRVSGVNRSLQQSVVFVGNLVPWSNEVALGVSNQFAAGVGGQLQNTASNLDLQQLLSNSRITGTAVVNRTNALEINAVPVNP